MPHFQLSKDHLRAEKTDRAGYLLLPRRPVYLLLDGVSSYHNIGAILRLADAVRLEKVFVCGPRTALTEKKLRRTAKSAERWVDWQVCGSAEEVAKALREQGVHLVAVELTNRSREYQRLSVSHPVCLVLGNELSGISAEVLSLVDEAIHLPMDGMCNSLNVATAAAVTLYHCAAQIPIPSAGTPT